MPLLRRCLVALALSALVCASPSIAVADDSAPVATAPATSVRGELPLRVGDTGPYLSLLHERLAWLGYDIASRERTEQRFGATTLEALHALADKMGVPRADVVGERAWERIRRQAGRVGQLPAACTSTGKVICLDVERRLLRLVRDGRVLLTTDARFGVMGQQTRRGTFRVQRRSADHFSSLYRTSMPLALFFSGGQAIHYSSFFARDGYAGGSHGCVNLRDRTVAQRVFDWAPLGTVVHIG